MPETERKKIVSAFGAVNEDNGISENGSRGIIATLIVLAAISLLGCGRTPRPGQVQDEAMAAGRAAQSFPAADEDYFHDMDGGLALTPDEIKGRNMWQVWTGGNDRFWEKMTVAS